MGRFINPFTDYGFKFLFGREVEKELFRLDAVYGVFFMNFVMDKDMPATIRQMLSYPTGLQESSLMTSFGKSLSNCQTLIKKRMNAIRILNAGFIY